MKRVIFIMVFLLLLAGFATAEGAGVTIIEPKENSTFFPDPNRDQYGFEYKLPAGESGMLEIIDTVTSEIVIGCNLSPKKSDYVKLNINESELIPGRQYQVNLTAAGETASVRFTTGRAASSTHVTTASTSTSLSNFAIDSPQDNSVLAPDELGKYRFELKLPYNESISYDIVNIESGETVYSTQDPPLRSEKNSYYYLGVSVEEKKLVPGKKYQFNLTVGGNTKSIHFTTAGSSTTETDPILNGILYSERISKIVQSILSDTKYIDIYNKFEGSININGEKYDYNGSYGQQGTQYLTIPDARICYVSATRPQTSGESALDTVNMVLSILNNEKIANISEKKCFIYGYDRLNDDNSIILFMYFNEFGVVEQCAYIQNVSLNDDSTFLIQSYICTDYEIVQGLTNGIQEVNNASSELKTYLEKYNNSNLTNENKSADASKESTAASKTDTPVTGKCTANKVNVRREPSMNAGSLGQINRDDRVTVLENLGEWSKISCKRGEGYIKTQYIQLDK